MKYAFPYITHIADVLTAIEGKKEFIVAKKDGYTVINYVISGNDTFPDVIIDASEFFEQEEDYNASLLRECRGITFDSETGEVIARKFHKFFNLNEREETNISNINFSRPHYVAEKLDGSMITPVMVAGELEWHTKMGNTDVAQQAAEWVEYHPNYRDFALACLYAGLTPIFEWCSLQNRIVVEHPKDRLVLLAVRYLDTGEYITREELKMNALMYELDLVNEFGSVENPEEFVAAIRAWDTGEGVVISFDDGHKIKLKADLYCQLHRTKDMIQSERHIVNLIVNYSLDDLRPLIMKEDLERVNFYEKAFLKEISVIANFFSALVQSAHDANVDRKDFAIYWVKHFHPKIQGVMFKEFENPGSFYQNMINTILKSTSNNKNFAEAKEAFFPVCQYGALLPTE